MKNIRCLERDSERLMTYYGQRRRAPRLVGESAAIVRRQFDDGWNYEMLSKQHAIMEYGMTDEATAFKEYEVPGVFADYEEVSSKPLNPNPVSQANSMAWQFGEYIEPFEMREEKQVEQPVKQPCNCTQHNAQPANIAHQDDQITPPQPQKESPPAPPPPTATRPNEAPAGTNSASQSIFPDLSDDDFMADMKSIMAGKKQYDPSKKMVSAKSNQQERPAANQYEEPPLAPLESKNEHAIFDKIAQSMRYANAYDLGAMEIEKRFSEFDRISDTPKTKTSEAKAAANMGDYGVQSSDTAEFLSDLDEVKRLNTAKSSIQPVKDLATEASLPFAMSAPAGQLVGTQWWVDNQRAKRRFPDEPETNIDQFTVPSQVEAGRFFDDFSNSHPTIAPIVIGDRAQAVNAQYFVVHDRGDNVYTEVPESVNDINPSARGVHLYIGKQRVLRVNDWHERGDGTGLEHGSNTCFVHVELTQHRNGLEEVRENGVLVKAAGTRFTLWQYNVLAYAYLVASLRRGRFLTVTIHREVDRALTGGHGDPRDFDMAFFYQRINALLGFGTDTNFTYGIQPDRVMALRQVNMSGYVNEFLPYGTGATHAANQYGPPRRNPDGSWDSHPRPTTGPRCGNGQLFNT